MSNEKTFDTTTHCHNCIFAELEAVKPGSSSVRSLFQSGCKLNRLDKFEDKELVNIDDVSAYKINRICMACRDESWAEGKDNPKQDVYDEMKVTVDFVLVIDIFDLEEGEPNLDKHIKNLQHSLTSIINQGDMKANSVVLVFKNKHFGKHVNKFLKEMSRYLDKNDIKYQVLRCFEDDAVYHRLHDIGVQKCRGVFHVGYRVGDIIPTNILERINRAINHELYRFVLLKQSDVYHQVVMNNYHKLLSGNDGGYIEDKIQYYAKQQDNNEMVKEWNEIPY